MIFRLFLTLLNATKLADGEVQRTTEGEAEMHLLFQLRLL